MNLPCNCATSMLAFLGGSDMAQDVIKNIPPVMMRRAMPAEIMAGDKEKLLGQFLDWMIIGASEMRTVCSLDIGSTVQNLVAARQQLTDIGDEKLNALIIQSYNEVHLALTDCALIELSVSRSESLPGQEAALKRLGSWKLVKMHDDGNVTVETEAGKYIVTTEGFAFKEEAQGG